MPPQSPLPPPLPSPLNLIIRFPLSLPDLPLHIPNPHTTTPLSLKLLIRPHLPPAHQTSALRLIHSGFPLPETTPLSTSLKLPPQQQQQPTYIHCSISTPLSPAALATERHLATATSTPTPRNAINPQQAAPSPRQQQQPTGFDRLLTAGLTPPEIASLRSQFLLLQAHTHTPDTMPDGHTLRRLEEQWLDSGPSGVADGGGSDNGGGGGGGGGENEEEGGALEDMLWGNLMGFFWAVGAGVWLLREEGVWSRRRQIAVCTGLLVNVAFSVLKVTS